MLCDAMCDRRMLEEKTVAVKHGEKRVTIISSSSHAAKEDEGEGEEVKKDEPREQQNTDTSSSLAAAAGGDNNSKKKSTACESQIDPFKSQPVEKFKPPAGSSLQDTMDWEDRIKDLTDRIRKLKTGGAPLRETIRKEVRALQLVRFQMFCKYV